jgi:hypothetical protein
MHTELSSANTDDSLLFEPLLETNLGVRGYRHRHGVESSCRLGWIRWIVERAVFWLLRFKRLGHQPQSAVLRANVKQHLPHGRVSSPGSVSRGRRPARTRPARYSSIQTWSAVRRVLRSVLTPRAGTPSAHAYGNLRPIGPIGLVV